MAKDIFGKWKKGESAIGYEDDEQQLEGKMILDRMASIMTADQSKKEENRVDVPAEKTPGDLPDSNGYSDRGSPETAAEIQARVDISAGMIENKIPFPKTENTFDPEHSEINTSKDISESYQLKPVSEEESTAPSTITKKKESPAILVVEDEPVTQRLLKKILEEQRGYGVVIAGDGIDALMELGKREFDLVLSDLSMPNLDGFKLLDFINMKNIRTPVIFLTGSDDVEDEIKVLALGAKDYIRKPINRDLLLLRISKVLNR
jgi:CheY-like chemotaxis protein